MSKQDKRPYLFLMQHPSFEARRAAAEQLRELSMTVVAHYGSHAIEALATDDQAEAASRLGIFGAPSFVVEQELFWGDDRLEMALARAAA